MPVLNPAQKSSVTHHCPKEGGREGNCRSARKGKRRYCKQHQEVCDTHDHTHLKSEPCVECEAELVICSIHKDITYNKYTSCPTCDREKESCPKRSKGGCNYTNTPTFWYCQTHQLVCREHHGRAYMNYDKCPSCPVATTTSRID